MKTLVRVVLVDDYEPWRRFERLALLEQEDLHIVAEAADAEKALQKVQQLQPDLILLDISMPGGNGINAARQILQVAPNSKILFVSENRSPSIVREALNIGAAGFVIKADAARDLLPAIKAVRQGKNFVSASLRGHLLVAGTIATQVISLIVR